MSEQFRAMLEESFAALRLRWDAYVHSVDNPPESACGNLRGRYEHAVARDLRAVQSEARHLQRRLDLYLLEQGIHDD